MIDALSLSHAYMDAKRFVIQEGFGWEVDWQASVSLEELSEQRFLREYSWVVLNAGFREAIVRGVFPCIERSFGNWRSAAWVWDCRQKCRQEALKVFGNRRKVSAILNMCRIVAKRGFPSIHNELLNGGPGCLLAFPFMGPATSLHLAKNLGIQVVKPDRHLIRLADAAGFRSPREMCESVQQLVGDTLAEIDVVLWRFATLVPEWQKHFSPNGRHRATRRTLLHIRSQRPYSSLHK